MMNNTNTVSPFRTVHKNPVYFSQNLQMPQNQTSLHFEGPLPKTPVAFGSKVSDERKRQTAMQTALQQASMLMTIPVLLGVNGISYITGAEEPELILINPNGGRIDLIA